MYLTAFSAATVQPPSIDIHKVPSILISRKVFVNFRQNRKGERTIEEFTCQGKRQIYVLSLKALALKTFQSSVGDVKI